MSTPAQREAVARVLCRRRFPYLNASVDHLRRYGFLVEADDIIAAYEALANAPTHRHRKGGLYHFVGYAFDTEDLDREVAVYRSCETGLLWWRPRDMFDDGRFTPIETETKDHAP